LWIALPTPRSLRARSTPRSAPAPPQVPPEAIDLDFVPVGHNVSWWETVELTKLDVSRRVSLLPARTASAAR